MKTIIVLLFLSVGAFSYGQNESTCNADNFLDFVTQPGKHDCDLQGVNLGELYLAGANFSYANLTGAILTGAWLAGARIGRHTLMIAKRPPSRVPASSPMRSRTRWGPEASV